MCLILWGTNEFTVIKTLKSLLESRKDRFFRCGIAPYDGAIPHFSIIKLGLLHTVLFLFDPWPLKKSNILKMFIYVLWH